VKFTWYFSSFAAAITFLVVAGIAFFLLLSVTLRPEDVSVFSVLSPISRATVVALLVASVQAPVLAKSKRLAALALAWLLIAALVLAMINWPL
jgi:hypothetical protein